MIQQLQFAIGITGPVLLLLSLGFLLRRHDVISPSFITPANTLVFRFAMPAMLFLALSDQPLETTLDIPLAAVGLLGTLIIILLVLLIGRLMLPLEQRGVFVQGSYRGNLAILALALSVATYGREVLPVVALYIALVTTLYNVVAVWLLSANGAVFKSIATNPIILGIVAGIVMSALPMQVPTVLVRTGEYLSDMTLPVALLCIGASLDLSSLRTHWNSVLLAGLFKLLISPLLLVSMGIALGLRDERLGVLFFMSAAPTASASYIMARQMTTQGPLAAEIVAVTTAIGVITYTFGLALLRYWALI